MKMKRIVPVLVLSLLLPVFAACGGGNGSTKESTGKETMAGTASAATGNGETTETAGMIEDPADRLTYHHDLGEKNYDGRDFSILGLRDVYDFVLDETEPESRVESALWRRDATVEDALKINIRYTAPMYNELVPTFENSVASGGGFDLYLGQLLHIGSEVLNGYCLKWSELSDVNFEKPWYTDNTVNALTLNDNLYICVGALNMSDLGFTNCMFFSKDAAEDYKLGDIYEIVNSGSWTYDKLLTTVKDIYADTNGDSEVNEGDYYGLSMRTGDFPVFMWAFDQKMVSFHDDGAFSLSFNSEKTADIIDKLKNLCYSNLGVTMTCALEPDYKGMAIFRSSQSAFTFGYVGQTLSYLASYDDYGIIPYPMYNEEQKEYFTMVDGTATGMVVPFYVSDTDFVGSVIEALNCETWRTCELEYYDKALKTRGTRDEEGKEMLDLIFNSRVTDIQYIHDAWQGYAFALEVICQPGSTWDLASYCASRDEAVGQHYRKLADYYFEKH